MGRRVVARGNKTDTREFEFTQQDFEQVRKLIYQHAGISLGPHKFDMVYSRLARRLRALGIKSFAQYLAQLQRNDAPEWQPFINALTTNLTSFFREAHHFPILAEHVKKNAGKRPISIWCSAASTGEEPYSIAMTLVDALGSYTPAATIIASDLDTNVLKVGETGVYPRERVDKLPEDQLKRFFLKGTGVQDGQVKVRDELRQMIVFRQINLLDDRWPVRPPFDAIFCRNVMIYFDRETQYRILKKFVPLLQPDGLLFAGHSESFHHAADLFKPLGKTVYGLASTYATAGRVRV